jgi:hypothetical protein
MIEQLVASDRTPPTQEQRLVQRMSEPVTDPTPNRVE